MNWKLVKSPKVNALIMAKIMHGTLSVKSIAHSWQTTNIRQPKIFNRHAPSCKKSIPGIHKQDLTLKETGHWLPHWMIAILHYMKQLRILPHSELRLFLEHFPTPSHPTDSWKYNTTTVSEHQNIVQTQETHSTSNCRTELPEPTVHFSKDNCPPVLHIPELSRVESPLLSLI